MLRKVTNGPTETLQHQVTCICFLTGNGTEDEIKILNYPTTETQDLIPPNGSWPGKTHDLSKHRTPSYGDQGASLACLGPSQASCKPCALADTTSVLRLSFTFSWCCYMEEHRRISGMGRPAHASMGVTWCDMLWHDVTWCGNACAHACDDAYVYIYIYMRSHICIAYNMRCMSMRGGSWRPRNSQTEVV